MFGIFPFVCEMKFNIWDDRAWLLVGLVSISLRMRESVFLIWRCGTIGEEMVKKGPCVRYFQLLRLDLGV
jgi:hypothetical protein